MEIALAAWEPVFDSFEQILGSELFELTRPGCRESKAEQIRAACQLDAPGHVLVAQRGSTIAGFVSFYPDVPVPGVGEIGNNYQVRAYVGGRLDETGTLREPEGLRTAFLEIDDRVVNQWIEVPFAEGTRADNVELWTLGPTDFFEVEIYVRSPGESVVRPATWGHVKSGH